MEEQPKPSLLSVDYELTLPPIEFVDQAGAILASLDSSNPTQGPYINQIYCMRNENSIREKMPTRQPFLAIDRDLYPRDKENQDQQLKGVAQTGRF